MPVDASKAKLLDVLIIGSGFSGIGMAIRARQAGLRILVLERAGEVGGTWRENTYPGCACDTQSHHYSFSFARNPDWSRRFAPQPEILAYLQKVAADFDVYRSIRFDEAVESLEFDGPSSTWLARSSRGNVYRAPFVVSSVGQLNQPLIPDLPGLDSFTGEVMHTATWNHDYDFGGKRVAVVGSGASALQLIPPVAAECDEMIVYQRTPSWVVAKQDREFGPWEKRLFRYLPLWAWLYRASIYWSWEISWPEFIDRSRRALKRTAELRQYIRELVRDDCLVQKLTPDYPLGCKRVLLSDDFYQAMQRDNVSLVDEPLLSIEDGTLRTASGRVDSLDCIVFATGFRAHDFLPGIEVRGRDGLLLHDEWARGGGAEAYLGITMPGFPNLFFTYGPNTNLGHNSIVFMIECQIDYILAAIRLVRNRGAASIEVEHWAKNEFDQRLRREFEKTAFAGSCSSWYKTSAGKIINNWSSNTVRYWWLTRRPRLDHYQFE